jgi:hypothetical protein
MDKLLNKFKKIKDKVKSKGGATSDEEAIRSQIESEM